MNKEMIKKVGLVISDADKALIDAGKLVRTDGILRDAETKKIVKHLQVVELDKKSCWQELRSALSRVFKENKKGVIIAGSVVVVTATAVGGYVLYKKRKAKKLEEKCNALINKAIQNYVDSATKGELDMGSVTACEDALMSLPRITDKVFVSMTKEQIIAFTNNLKEYTERLAEVNHFEIEDSEVLSYTDNVLTCFLNNLQIQKAILSVAA